MFQKFLLLSLSLFVVVGCTKPNRDVKVKLSNGERLVLPVTETLRIHIVSEPPTLDWHKQTDTTSSLISGNIMDGLVAYDISDENLPLKPALAESWKASNNSKTWTFKLRKDVKWTDGKAFTADHVVDGWKRLIDPATASEYSYFLFAIKNARAFNEGSIKDFSEVGIKKIDDYTVVVDLAKPMSFFPSLLTHQSTFPIRLDVVQAHGDSWTEAENIVTLGAFKLKVWKHDELIVLERNDGYFNQAPKVKYVVARMIEKLSTAVRLFENGKLDSMHEVPSKDLRKIKKKPEFTPASNLLLYYYGFNVKKKPFDNPKVRQAIAHAIDRKELVKLLDGGQTAMTGWIPKGLLGYDENVGRAFDLEKAKALFKEAGFADPTQFPTLTIGFNTNEDHQRVAENIQSQLRKNLGIKVELRNEEWKVYLDRLKSDAYPIFRLGWIADYPDPDNFMNLMTSYSENNRTNWGSETYDRLVENAASELDEKKRLELYNKAQKLLVEDEIPAMPLYRGVRNHLISKRVQKYPVNFLGYYRFWEVELK